MAILSKQRASSLAISITCVLVLSACLSKNADQRPMPSQVDTLYAHQQSLVLDAHADIVLASTSRSYLAADGSSKVSPDKLKAGGVGAVVMSIAVGPGPRTAAADGRARTLAEQKLAAVQALLLANRDALVLAKSVTDIASAQESGMTAIILGFQNARSLQGNVDALDEFYASGVRLFGLNHKYK
jgi:membrane dipeptidase